MITRSVARSVIKFCSDCRDVSDSRSRAGPCWGKHHLPGGTAVSLYPAFTVLEESAVDSTQYERRWKVREGAFCFKYTSLGR